MKTRFIYSLIVLILIPYLYAYGNCEAGGYSIHTTATYKKSDPSQIIFIYSSEGKKFEAKVNSIDQDEWTLPYVKKAGKKLDVSFVDKTCALKSGWSLDPKFKVDEPYSSEKPYWLDLSQCNLSIPNQGYAIFDANKGALKIAQELEVKKLKSSTNVPESIKKDIRDRDLYLSTDPNWNSGASKAGEGKITPDMITSQEVETTEIGPKFKMSVAILTLKGAAEKYPKEFLSKTLSPSFIIKYPVIYFKHPKNAEYRYVGDGSTCSYPRINEATVLAELDRFVVTKAFDFDGDKTPDLVEINNDFTYWIESDGTPTVVSYGLGC